MINNEKSNNTVPISEAIEISKSYSARSGLHTLSGKKKFLHAVNNCSIKIYPGQSVGLVGESGCGKSTLGRLLLRLETPTSGKINFDGKDITKLKGRKLRKQRQQMQIIFQDPASSLNPGFTVENTLAEALTIHKGRINSREMKTHIAALLNMVGLSSSALDQFPGEFSSGEKQRISIARSLAVEPRFLVADEPVTSLDQASQEQILKLLETIKRELNVAILYISHDIDIVKRMCSRIAVMYMGTIVENAPTQNLFSTPMHPYTRALLASRLSTDPSIKRKLNILQGDPPSPLNPPTGCFFHTRCPYKDIQCEKIVPQPRLLIEKPENNHTVSCHFNFKGNKKEMTKDLKQSMSLGR